MNIPKESEAVIRSLTQKTGLAGLASEKSRCLVIGSGPSIKSGKRAAYVDGFDGLVIRINRLPFPELTGFYGKRTDLLFTTEWSEKTVCKYDFSPKIVLRHEDILAASVGFGGRKWTWMTTGMVCILMALSAFESVELLGFGGGESGSVHTSLSYANHDLAFEHGMIRELMRTLCKGRLGIVEEASGTV